ncbi:hypothetical protein MJM28_28555, partial [Salmonella enterica subsp. enterica serovar Montevideo]|nr:hypothetical protein [Salmonella enterica subsp. enterica serovar Montevideo]
PKAYLARLRQEVGPACYITVEKILAKGEQLPDDWPVSGTTGYVSAPVICFLRFHTLPECF